MRLFFIVLSIFFIQNSAIKAQSDLTDLKPEEYFDFWVGEWNLSWTDNDGQAGLGTNHITKVLDEIVIQENFEATEGKLKGFKGKSFSVYNTQTQMWHQAWVDNQGGYIDLKGKIEGDKRIFQTAERTGPQGNKIMNRMVFYDIKLDSFTWSWEYSTDEGKSWTVNWKIFYKKK